MSARKYDINELIRHIAGGGTVADFAKANGVKDSSNIYQTVKRLKARGLVPGDPQSANQLQPEDTIASRFVTLHKYPEGDPEGRVLRWIRANRELSDQLADARIMLNAMTDGVKPLKPVKPRDVSFIKDAFTVIPVGDPHIGLMTWSKEVGAAWDLKIAQRVFRKVVTRLLSEMPDTEECVLFNSGDFFHADNIQGMTSRSGHRLDLDGRHSKWLDVGVVIFRMLVDSCREKYAKVTVINTPGNHDDILGSALGVFAAHLYENEPRVEVLRGEAPFQYIHRGDVLLGFAHGHTCKLNALPGKMADDQYKLWGRTIHRHWFTGHVHHNSWTQFKEHPGCAVETVGIIPPKDAYAFGGAYGGGRTLQGVIFDKKYGFKRRHIERVRGND